MTDRNRTETQQDLFGARTEAPNRRPVIPFRPMGSRVVGNTAPTPPAARPVSSPTAKTPAPKKTGGLFGGLAAMSPQDAPPDVDAIPDGPAPEPGDEAPDTPTSVEIKGTIRRIIYENGDFRVYAIRSKGEEVSAKITSPIKPVEGEKVVLRGEWGMYKGRRSFNAKIIIQDLPTDKKGVATWIRTGAVPGVGKATADRIVKHFGESVLEVIDKPERLVECGIDLQKAQAIADAWSTNAMQPELIAYLGSLGLGEMTITKVIRRYGMTARETIERNPWQLAETIDGIGFQKADEIARAAGHAKESPDRIRAGISFTLNEAVNRDGHCGLPRRDLVTRSQKLLNVPRPLVEEQLDPTLDGSRNLYDEISELASPRGIHAAENDLTRHVLRLLDGAGMRPEEAEAAIEAAEAEMNIHLDPSQRDAALLALTNNVTIITGGPGTGKSTTQKVVVHALRAADLKVSLGAPTGRAAKRLSEVSGLPASTCHRLLAFSSEVGGFTYHEDNPFDEDWHIIDEFSMVDTRLGASFIQAIATGSGLTIVGDVDQLPSVGAGQVLRDLIESEVIPTARLTTVHRQGKDSGIVTAAHRINSGQHPMPEGTLSLDGFEIQSVSGAEAIVAHVVDLMAHKLPSMGYDPLKDVQVLAAMRRGPVGINALNDALKDALNPPKDDGNSIDIKGKTWSVGDRVMHIRNDYAKEVYNGEVGFVSHAGQRLDEETARLEAFIRVDYSGYTATYGAKDIDDLEPCWAATVHKSQGCEFPVVIMVCPWDHSNILSRNLFYTGVTRAKTLCLVVGDDLAIGQAVARANSLRRHTGLPKFLNAARAELAPEDPDSGFLPMEEP